MDRVMVSPMNITREELLAEIARVVTVSELRPDEFTVTDMMTQFPNLSRNAVRRLLDRKVASKVLGRRTVKVNGRLMSAYEKLA